MAAKIATSLDLSGPFFRVDPRKTFRANARAMLQAIAEEAAKDIQTQMQAGEAGRAFIRVGGGRVSAQVQGYASGVRSGNKWALTSRVHILNSGLSKSRAISLHAAAARIEARSHPFRRTAGRMRRAKAINRAELLKGLQ